MIQGCTGTTFVNGVASIVFEMSWPPRCRVGAGCQQKNPCAARIETMSVGLDLVTSLFES
jgi:hypothetical protein